MHSVSSHCNTMIDHLHHCNMIKIETSADPYVRNASNKAQDKGKARACSENSKYCSFFHPFVKWFL